MFCLYKAYDSELESILCFACTEPMVKDLRVFHVLFIQSQWLRT